MDVEPCWFTDNCVIRVDKKLSVELTRDNNRYDTTLMSCENNNLLIML